MKKRLALSLLFTIPLFYLSMGHMMGWPIPRFFHGMENAMTYALTLFLLTVPIMVINQKYYRVGFKTLHMGGARGAGHAGDGKLLLHIKTTRLSIRGAPPMRAAGAA